MNSKMKGKGVKISCYECAQTPSEFTILVCNHILCEDCFYTVEETNQSYSIIKCMCGITTYLQKNHQNRSQKYQNNHNYSTVNHFHSIEQLSKSRNTNYATHQKNTNQKPVQIQIDDSFLFQENYYPLQNTLNSQENSKKNKRLIQEELSKIVNKGQKTQKQLISNEISVELNFLNKIFKKQLDHLKNRYDKRVKEIEQDYKMMIKQIKSLYLEQILDPKSLDEIDISTFMNSYFEKNIKSQINKLAQNLKNEKTHLGRNKCIENGRCLTENVRFLTENVNDQTNKNLMKKNNLLEKSLIQINPEDKSRGRCSFDRQTNSSNIISRDYCLKHNKRDLKAKQYDQFLNQIQSQYNQKKLQKKINFQKNLFYQ